MNPDNELDAELQMNICYDGPMNREMEKSLKEVAESYGWTWYAQGTDMITGERDMSFYKQKT